MFNKKYMYILTLLALTHNLVCMEDAEDIKPQDLASNELTIQSFIDAQKKQTQIILKNVDGRIEEWAGVTIKDNGGIFLQGSDRNKKLLAYIKLYNNGSAYLHTPELSLNIVQSPNGQCHSIKSYQSIRSASIALAGTELWNRLSISIVRDLTETTKHGVQSATFIFNHATKN